MRKKYYCIMGIVLAIVFLSNLPSARPDSQADAIIKELLKKFEASKNIKVDFKQKFQWKLTDDYSEQAGTIWLAGKEKFKIITEDQTIISDGITLWTYSKTNNQVIIDKVDHAEDINLPRDILLSYSDLYSARYLKKEKIENKDYHFIELFAKSDEQFIKLIKIWIEEKELILLKIEQIDLNENVNEYILANFILNVPLGANFFKYDTPDSVEVIDMR